MGNNYITLLGLNSLNICMVRLIIPAEISSKYLAFNKTPWPLYSYHLLISV
jgi:hypothetical protein